MSARRSPKREYLVCSRCAREVEVTDETFEDHARVWNVVLSRGVVTGNICPSCQSAEENAEAEINEATTAYRTDAFGRVVGSPKRAA